MLKLTRKQFNRSRRVVMEVLNEELASFNYQNGQNYLFAKEKYDYTYATDRFYCEKWDFGIEWLPAIQRWMAR